MSYKSEENVYSGDGCDDWYYKYALLNLLAIIHGDGRQYVTKVGVRKAVKDAVKIVTDCVVK